MHLTFLSGGTGTPKLLQGFRQLIDDSKIGVICNTGDDYKWFNLHISPDLDTLLYLFSQKLDLTKFWGVKADSFNALETMKSLNSEDCWFNVGDKDLGLHIFRSTHLKSKTLTDITKSILELWNIEAIIVPMCDQLLRSIIYSGNKEYNFQEYFVKHQCQIDVDKVVFDGSKTKTTEDVKDLLKTSNSIIFGPSNPITSIGPIISIQPLHALLCQNRKKVIAISPIIGNSAFSGPTTKLMEANEIEISPIGLAEYYKEIISTLILDTSDRHYKKKILDLNIEPIFMDINLSHDQQKRIMAESILDFI